MRKLIVLCIGLVIAGILAAKPNAVFAAGTLRPEMCKAVSIIPTLNKSDVLKPLTTDGQGPIITIDNLDNSTLYYTKNDALTKIEIGHHYQNVTAKVRVDTALLSPYFPTGIPADLKIYIQVSGAGCSDTDIPSSQFGRDNDLTEPYWDYCQRGFLGYDSHKYNVHIHMNSSDILCPGFEFTKGEKPSVQCNITLNRPQGYTTNDDVVITSIDNIQAQCMGNPNLDYYRDYFPVITCSRNMTVNGTSQTCGTNGDLSMFAGVGWAQLGEGKYCDVHSVGPYNLGKLDSGTYTVEASRIRQWIALDRGHDKIYCSKTFTVVLPNETLTPEATNSADVGGTTSVNVRMASAIALCESIPGTSMCGGVSCKQKCENCSKPAADGSVGGIWTALGCLPTDITQLVNKLFTYFSGILGGFIFICIVWNGIKVMMSRGAPDALKKAQEAITSCIIGLLVLVFSVLFLQVVGVDILKIPGWTKTATTVQTTP